MSSGIYSTREQVMGCVNLLGSNECKSICPVLKIDDLFVGL